MTLPITATNLTLKYGDVTAVDNLSFRLEGGKIYGLLGRNGSGKSSLLSVMAAFRKPTAGDIHIGGQPVFENPAITSQVCLIRESGDTIDDSEKVEHALNFAAAMRPNWDNDFAKSLAERLKLPLDKPINQLSRGQRSALGITLGLATRAPVTMLDESYLGLDAPSRYAFYEALLEDFLEHPRTFLISTHLIEEVSSLFEEVLIIDQGRLVLHEDADTLRSRGAAVTGPAESVDQFVADLTVLNEKRLGRTKSAMVYGNLTESQRQQAESSGLDLEPLALQDLFVYLTEPKGDLK